MLPSLEGRDFAVELAEKLAERRRGELVKMGATNNEVKKLQSLVLDFIKNNYQDTSLLNDSVFQRFVLNMCLIAARAFDADGKGINFLINDISSDKTRVFVEYLADNYRWICDKGQVPRSLIERLVHRFSLFGIYNIQREAVELFGGDPEAKDVARTAAFLVFEKRYESVGEAYRAYQDILTNVRNVVGGGSDREALVRKVTFLVFKKQYSTIEEAYNACLASNEIASE